MTAQALVITAVIGDLGQAHLPRVFGIRTIPNEVLAIGVPGPMHAAPAEAHIDREMKLLKAPVGSEDIRKSGLASILDNVMVTEIEEQSIALWAPAHTIDHQGQALIWAKSIL
jgi:hypothetical protein